MSIPAATPAMPGGRGASLGNLTPYLRLVDKLIEAKDPSGRSIGRQFAGNAHQSTPGRSLNTLEAVKQSLNHGTYSNAIQVYQSLLRCFTSAQRMADRKSSRWADAITMEVYLQASWQADPELPRIPEVKNSLGASTALGRSPSTGTITATSVATPSTTGLGRDVDGSAGPSRFSSAAAPVLPARTQPLDASLLSLSHFHEKRPIYLKLLHRLQTNKHAGRIIGGDFLEGPPAAPTLGLDNIERRIRLGLYKNPQKLYHDIAGCFRASRVGLDPGSQRYRDAKNMELRLIQIWSSTPHLPPWSEMTKGLQEYTPPASVAPSSSTLPSTRSPKKTPSHPQAGSKRVPGTAPSLGSAGSPATVSSRAQTANEIDKIVRLPSTVLAKIARSTTCEQLMATKTMIGDEDAPTIFQLLMRIPPEPEDVPYPEHPGLPLLLGKGYIPDYPGIVCSPQPRSEEWPSRRAWAQSRLKSLLPRKEMALQVEEWALTQLVDYTISVDDYQIHLETESANHYALIAANAVVARIKARGQGRESEKEPETAQALYASTLRRHYLQLHKQARRVLGLSNGGVLLKESQGRIGIGYCQASAVAGMVAIQVAALELALRCNFGDASQLEDSIKTGLRPAIPLQGKNKQQPPILPHFVPPEPNFRWPPYWSLSNDQAASELTVRISYDMRNNNTHTPDQRDYLISKLCVLFRQQPTNPAILPILLSIKSFYPEWPSLIMLLSSYYLAVKQPITALMLSTDLVGTCEARGEVCAEALANAATAYIHIQEYDSAQHCLLRAMTARPLYWEAVKTFMHLQAVRRAVLPWDTIKRMESELWPDLAAKTGGSRAREHEPRSIPKHVPLIDIHQAQQLYLVLAEVFIGTRAHSDAVQRLVEGVELVTFLKRTSGEGTGTCNMPVPFTALLKSAYFHIRQSWASQQGEQGATIGKKIDTALDQAVAGSGVKVQQLKTNTLWHAMTSPQWFENLPVSPQDGVYPILLVAPSTISSLARSTFSVGRPSSIASTPPAAYAVNVDPDVRRRADSDIKQATSNLLLALAKLIYQDSQDPLNAEQLTTAMLKYTGAKPLAGFLLCLYYLAHSLHPRAIIAQNVALLCVEIHYNAQAPPVKLVKGDQVYEFEAIDFAWLWALEAISADTAAAEKTIDMTEIQRILHLHQLETKLNLPD